ncbi:hypothetical protein [Streptomyces albipurpureus]|uniref:Uncharacterized protein n=1 Tax=Streptomyces albipurpureus TaxID=2897419 RepID=A0ABT0UUZ1_9ACTN|nr:hypothetical protein [Streptomyces sp. CWNU-1]MCM2392397.1 hypothetical protein [Streptomyces sp. CWNU-1]
MSPTARLLDLRGPFGIPDLPNVRGLLGVPADWHGWSTRALVSDHPAERIHPPR